MKYNIEDVTVTLHGPDGSVIDLKGVERADTRVVFVGHVGSNDWPGHRLVGRTPGIIIVDEVEHNQKSTDDFIEVMDRLRHCAVADVMRDVRKAYQQKHGPRDRWGKCK